MSSLPSPDSSLTLRMGWDASSRYQSSTLVAAGGSWKERRQLQLLSPTGNSVSFLMRLHCDFLLPFRTHPCLTSSCPQTDHSLSAPVAPSGPSSTMPLVPWPCPRLHPSPPVGLGSTGIQSPFSYLLGGSFTLVTRTDLDGLGLRCIHLCVSLSSCVCMYVAVGVSIYWGSRKGMTASPTLQ